MARKKHIEVLKHESNKIIKSHMFMAMGAGLIPIPFADIIGVGAVQLDMIRKISKIFDVDFKDVQVKAIITSLTGSSMARIGASSVVKFIPGVGAIAGGISMAAFSAASTYALGEVTKKHFESGGTFVDLDPERLKDFYEEKFKQGKEMAKKMKEEKENEIVLDDNDDGSAEQITNQEPAQNPSPDTAQNNHNTPIVNKEKVRDVVDKLNDLARLHSEGIITKGELEKAKKRLLK